MRCPQIFLLSFLLGVSYAESPDSAAADSGSMTEMPVPSPASLHAEAPAQKVSLTITSTPSDAVVFLDTIRVGRTPVVIDWPETGARQISLRKSGYFLLREAVTLTGGDDSLHFILVKPATVTVIVNPPEALVGVDGQTAEPSPRTLGPLRPGPVRIAASAASYFSVDTTLTVSGTGDTLHLTLRPVSSPPDTAIVPASSPLVLPRPGIYVTGALFLAFALTILITELIVD